MHSPDFTTDPALARVLRSSFARELCRSVEAYLDRCGMSASRFGREAVRDPSFVPRRLGDGQRVKLNTADKARGFMGEQTFRPVLVRETETFLEISGLGGWTVGDLAIGQRMFIKRLFAGGSPLLRTIDRFRRWMHRQLQPTERETIFLAVARSLTKTSGMREASVGTDEPVEERE